MSGELLQLKEQLDRIEAAALLGAKSVLTINETALLTGMSRDRLYHLSSRRQIPHYKQGSRTYFRKKEVEDWMTSRRVATQAEAESRAALYCMEHPAPQGRQKNKTVNS